MNSGGCSMRCFNSEGSYHCYCSTGYQLAEDLKACVDADECSLTNDCVHVCSNLPGTYQCECNEGFLLADNRKTCIGNKMGSKLCL